MRPSQKRKLKKAAKIGASGVGSAVLLVLKAIGTLILIGITTGMILACIFVIYAKTNLATNTLNADLEDFSLNLTSTIYYTDSETGEDTELIQLDSSETRIWVDIEDIPLDLQHAVVAIEDKRFYRHKGVDWYRTAGAFVNMFLGMRNTFGGSTLTQQLLKNLTGRDEVTVQRKLTEIFSALDLEKRYSKDDIMEGYLNAVYFGHSRYGIGAAAKYYFGKDVSQLSLAEMASIVGITNNPSIYSPYVDKEKNKERQMYILSEMYSQGWISKEQYDSAKKETLVFKRGENTAAEKVVYSYFVDAVFEDAVDILMEERGISYKTAERLLYTGGFKIYTTLDKSIQDKVDSVYEDMEAIPSTQNSNQQLQSAIVIIDHRTGNIVALSGGVGKKTISRSLNRATQAKRPAGSSTKPLSVYSPAMNLGLITPETRFEDEADIQLAGKPDWLPKNDDREYHGVVTIRQAVVNSLNVISAQVLDKLTPDASFRFMTEELCFTSLLPEDCDYAPLALGQYTNGVTVREMAAGFCIFPSGGIYTEPRTITKICDSDGNLLYDNVPETHAAISESTAYWMTSILQDAVTSGTGSGARLKSMPTAGKTGTSGSSKDRWFCGFTPYYTAAVWAGYDNPEKISTSGNPASKLWKAVMTLVHEDLEPKEFSKPSDTYLSPVPGVDPAIAYYIRGVATETVMSDVGIPITSTVPLYEEEAGERSPGREVTVTALEVEGYTLIGDSTVTFTLSDNPDKNLIQFNYVPVNAPTEPVVPDDPTPPDDPSDPSDPSSPGDPSDPTGPDEPAVPA